MLRDIRRGRGVLATVAVLWLAAAACSSSSATAAPTATASGSGVGSAPTAAAATGGDVGLSGTAANLAGLSSYTFRMTLAGNSFGSLLSLIGGGSTDANAPFTVGGTFVTSPATAADITMGSFHLIEIGGYDYMDLGTGGFVKTPVTGSGLASSFTPAAVYPTFINATAGSFHLVGSESKDGAESDHYQAGSTDLAEFGSVQGVSNATWTADVWVAKDGGYPVSVAIVARTGDTLAYEMDFDLAKVNDPSNSVTAPTNVTGA